MVERFHGRISEVLATHRYRSGEDLKSALERYVRLCNHELPQAALGHRAPIEALKEWQPKRPDLFRKKVYQLTGLDTYTCNCATTRVSLFEEPKRLIHDTTEVSLLLAQGSRKSLIRHA
jgi:hypothetical protein